MIFCASRFAADIQRRRIHPRTYCSLSRGRVTFLKMSSRPLSTASRDLGL